MLALLVPLLLGAVLVVPPYIGIYAATYLVYTSTEGASPLADKYLDVFYIVDAYNQLLSHWLANKTSLSFVDYTLPVVGLPVICTIFSIWLTIRLSRRFLDVFYGFADNN